MELRKRWARRTRDETEKDKISIYGGPGAKLNAQKGLESLSEERDPPLSNSALRRVSPGFDAPELSGR